MSNVNELEIELYNARQVYLKAIDEGDEKTENEYVDIIDAIAKIMNGTRETGYSDWYNSNEHERENLDCPQEIINEVRDFAEGAPKGFNKEIIDRWNEYLDFDLHEKLKTYGMVGAARLNKIFKLK